MMPNLLKEVTQEAYTTEHAPVFGNKLLPEWLYFGSKLIIARNKVV